MRSARSSDGDLDKFLKDQQPISNSQVYLNSVVDYQKQNVNLHLAVEGPISRVLVIYTGGTIGMQAHEGEGYIPVSNWFYECLARVHRFNDSNCHDNEKTDFVIFKQVIFKDGNQIGIVSVEQKPLITPTTLYGKRIKYNILEYDPLLDSADMTMTDWTKIATDIELNYHDFDAFVVVHGTDTMAYTASALSFMLEDLSKSVILTGSQVPLAEWRTDAEENLLCSLLMASHFVFPEVCLCFGHKLFRGNRTTKVNALDFAAFDSPNMKPIAEIGVNLNINWSDVRLLNTKSEARKFSVHKIMNPNVATLRLFPGITSTTVKTFLMPPIQGVVLETYGAGNAPISRTDILTILEEACQRGVVIVNCTQCKRGIVSDLYATGRALAALGVVPGSDMTPECALTKLCYLLGKKRSPKEIRQLMQVSLRGEMKNNLSKSALESTLNQ